MKHRRWRFEELSKHFLLFVNLISNAIEEFVCDLFVTVGLLLTEEFVEDTFTKVGIGFKVQ